MTLRCRDPAVCTIAHRTVAHPVTRSFPGFWIVVVSNGGMLLLLVAVGARFYNELVMDMGSHTLQCDCQVRPGLLSVHHTPGVDAHSSVHAFPLPSPPPLHPSLSPEYNR
jgi:hypothetical protein